MDYSKNPIMKYFAYEHLPEKLRKTSKPFAELATLIDESLPNCAENLVMTGYGDTFVFSANELNPTKIV